MDSRGGLMKAGINYDEGLKRMCNNEPLYQKFLGKFLQDKSMEELKEKLAAGNIEEAFRAAHTLKGVSGTLSLTPLYQKSSALCEKLRRGENGTPEEITETYEAYDAMVQAIKEWGVDVR